MKRLTIPDEKNRRWMEKGCYRSGRSQKICNDFVLDDEKV